MNLLLASLFLLLFLLQSTKLNTMLMNIDCWLLVLRQIPPSDRTYYRVICREWCGLIDYLSFTQKSLQLFSCQSDDVQCKEIQSVNSSDFFSWPHLNISYSEFVRIFKQYSNLESLVFTGFTHWNDHHLIRLTELCRSIKKLAFYSCPHLGKFVSNRI